MYRRGADLHPLPLAPSTLLLCKLGIFDIISVDCIMINKQKSRLGRNRSCDINAHELERAEPVVSGIPSLVTAFPSLLTGREAALRRSCTLCLWWMKTVNSWYNTWVRTFVCKYIWIYTWNTGCFLFVFTPEPVWVHGRYYRRCLCPFVLPFNYIRR